MPQKKNYGIGGGAGGVFGDVSVMLPKPVDIQKVTRFDLRFQLPDLRQVLRVSHLFCLFILKKKCFFFSCFVSGYTEGCKTENKEDGRQLGLEREEV